MIRALLMVVGLGCFVLVLTGTIAVGLLWQKGTLTAANLREIRGILSGSPTDSAESSAPAETAEVSRTLAYDEIEKQRLLRVLELDRRYTELGLLKNTTSNTANQLISEREAFDQMKKKFRDELQQINDRASAESTEQARLVLTSLPPDEAVKRLAGLTLDECVTLVRGMPEDSIAEILQAFSQDDGGAIRGQEIFESLSRGEPIRSVAGKAGNELTKLKP